MNRYTLFCTSEQTKKALNLGASIKHSNLYFEGSNLLEPGRILYAVIPTSEQMIGWLEEKGIFIEINIHTPDRIYADWKKAIYTFSVVDRFMVIHKHGGYDDTTHYPSRKEATLAAIDAALKYLTKSNK